MTSSADLTVPELALTVGGDTTLQGDVDSLAVSAPGSTFSFTDSDDLTIGTVDGVIGATATTLLFDTGGFITNASSITTTNLGVRAGGEVDLEADVDLLAVDAAGQTVRFTDSDDLAIGTVGGIAGLTADLANLTTGGSLTSSADLVVPALALTVGGDTTLQGDVDSLAVSAPGSTFSFTDSDDLTIGTVDGVAGATATTLLFDTGGSIFNASSLTATNLGVIAGGAVDLVGEVDTLAISAPGQTVSYSDFSDFSVSSVGGISGVTGQDVTLDGGTISFDVAQVIDGSLTIFSSSTNTVVFNDTLNGPGDLFIHSLGDILFNAAVGGTTPLGTVIVGSPLVSFSATAATLASSGLEAASAGLVNLGGDLTIASLFRAGDVLIKVNGAITSGTDPVRALDVAGLLVSGSSADLFGRVAGIFGLDAAAVAFSDPRLIETSGGLSFAPFDESLFLLNTCVIETLCDTFPIEQIVPRIFAQEEALKAQPTFQVEPSVSFIELFLPTYEAEEEFDERFSNFGNEEIW